MAVASSDLITTVEEAREYYRERLVGAHKITCCGKQITIFFDYDATHLYSEAADPQAIPAGAFVVTQQIAPGQSAVRVFNLVRARLMDRVLPAVSNFAVSLVGKGPRGREATA